MHSRVIAKIIVRNENSEILLLRRSSTDKRRPGEWDLPGGGIEEGEDIIAGSAREALEETGLSIKIDQFRLLYAGTAPWEPEQVSITRLILALPAVKNPKIKLSFEHNQFKWVDQQTALKDFKHFFYSRGLRYIFEHKLLEEINN